ncbi:unnamed protein product [Thelazia callipaeda]|uniref:Protein transport protein Sec24B n=1 Tax=Thelazia callipaeda TaxID=103827 RepID=A0A0N5CME2_THECL|nr:unnamed protein product [Thelazia callipaeda]
MSWQQQSQVDDMVSSLNGRNIQNTSRLTKKQSSESVVTSEGNFWFVIIDLAIGCSLENAIDVNSTDVLSQFQQHSDSTASNGSTHSLCRDSNTPGSTFTASCSYMHRQTNSIERYSANMNNSVSSPQMFPSFSATSFIPMTAPLHSGPVGTIPPPLSSAPNPSVSDITSNLKPTSAHQLLTPFTPPITNDLYKSDPRNETSVHHSYQVLNKSAPSSQTQCHYQMNGNGPSGLCNLQHDFSRMNFAVQSTRFIDLVLERNLMKYENEDEKITLPPTVCNPGARCNSSIFRCTLNSVPQTPELLKKSRLPFGLTLQPFRDMKSLNIIQTSTIVRCRYCRAYINPYVCLPDTRHWKCNICYRVNDLPDDFNWDPATKSFGEPTRRPEIRNATVEFIAPSEYTLRPPQPAVYVFIMDVSQNAIETGYLYTFTEQLLIALEQLPGDDRTMLCFIGVDSAIHFFQFYGESFPHHLIVDDYADIFLPVSCGLLVNLRQNLDVVRSFVQSLPTLYESNSSTSCCLGAALNAAHELIADIGGRITVFLTRIPDLGQGALKSREDPNQRAASEVPNLCPANDYYKRLALECTGHQIGVDLFLLSSHYADLSTLADVSKFSSGCIYYFPNYHINRNPVEVKRFQKQFNRYLIRKIGFEAVLRIRCTKGLSLHTFYGNFFVRSTDLLAVANVSPDSAIGVQVQMEENLVGVNTVCFQAAVLYTSSKGDRRIRIHTLSLPLTKDLSTLFNHFDVRCAISLVSRMAVERTLTGSSLADSREAMVNAVVDIFCAYNYSISQGNHINSVFSPTTSIRFFPLYVLGMLKHRAFTAGQSVKLDNRVAALLLFRSAPLEVIDLELYPALYELNHFIENETDPPRLHLSFANVNRNGVYLLDTGSYVYVYISFSVESNIIKCLFDVDAFAEIDEEKSFEVLDNPFSDRVHSFLRKLSIYRTVFAPVIIIREDSSLRDLFCQRLIEDRTESSHSYSEFLNHIQLEMQKY